MKFIHFGLRMEIERQYLDWCEREKHNPCGKTTRGCTLKGCHDMAAQNKKIIQE